MTKLILLLLCFCSSALSITYVCTTESKTDEEKETFYLVEYGDGITYVRTKKLQEEYVINSEDEEPFINEDYSPDLIIHETDFTLLLCYPGFKSMYRFTLLDKINKVWITDPMSPHFEYNETIAEYLKENSFSSKGSFIILDE